MQFKRASFKSLTTASRRSMASVATLPHSKIENVSLYRVPSSPITGEGDITEVRRYAQVNFCPVAPPLVGQRVVMCNPANLPRCCIPKDDLPVKSQSGPIPEDAYR